MTFRDNEALARHPLRRLQREATVEGSAVVAVGAAARRRDRRTHRHARGCAFDGVASGASAAVLHRRSSGNPLFLTQLLEAPVARRSRSGNGRVTGGGARRRALRRNANRCRGRGARRPAFFRPKLVRDVTGYGDAIVDRALDELLDRRLVQETAGRGILPYAFGHQLVQQAIAALAEPERLQRAKPALGARAKTSSTPSAAREFASQIAGRCSKRRSQPRRGGAQNTPLAGALRARTRRARRCAPRRRSGTWARGRSSHGRERAAGASASTNARATSAAERADLDALAAMAEELDDEELRCRVLLRRSRLAFIDFAGRTEAFVPLAELRERARRTSSLRWQAEADLLESMYYPLGVPASEAVALARARLSGLSRRSATTSGIAAALAEMAASTATRRQCR